MGSAVDEKLGKRVAALRRESGLTQAELAEKVDVVVETIARLERGATIPSLARLDEVAQALGVGLGELFETPSTPKEVNELLALLRGRRPDELALVRDLASRVLQHSDARRRNRK